MVMVRDEKIRNKESYVYKRRKEDGTGSKQAKMKNINI